MANLVEFLDAKISEAISGWSLVTTLLALMLLAFLAYPVVFPEEPDTHPLLLARQCTPSPVRNPGESAVYRSHEIPHGYPLRTGLNVKDPDASKWAAGRDGDIRDIWRKLVEEQVAEREDGSQKKSKIMTVLGKEEIIEHDIQDLTREINVIGHWIKQHGGNRVALYLPNSIEFLIALFASAFYGLSPILIPYNQKHDFVIDILRKTKADCLVAQAGSLPLGDLTKKVDGLGQVIWVVEQTSRHMDWSEVPDGVGGRVDVWVWHEVVQDHRGETSPELPNAEGVVPGNVVTIWQQEDGGLAEIVEFSQQNLVAAIASLISVLPANQRMNPSDLFLPAESLTHSYCLALTLAAIFSQASLAINSVAGGEVNLKLAARGIAPTVVVVSARTALHVVQNTAPSVTGTLKKLSHYAQGRALASGRLPSDGVLTRLSGPTRAAVGTTPGKLRLLFVSEKANANTPPLSSADLSDLRVYCACRVVYALTAAKVAGAVAQTNIFDYRRETMERTSKHNHFGVPLSSVEVKLVETQDVKIPEDGNPKGEIVVTGPAVAGGQTYIGVLGTFRDDHTLAYV